MTLRPPDPPDVLGAQRPRVLWVPPGIVSSSGQEAIELAALAGLDLDPWQQFTLDIGLSERADGNWAAFEIGVVVPRQNGKGGILEARELAGLFLLGERLITHSAHQFDTSLEAFRRLLELIESTPDLDQRVQRVSKSHGEEGIELKGGNRIRFRTRTRGGGRGFTGDCLILDEAMEIPQTAHGALLPTLSARPNPQVWYTGSAVDKAIHEHGLVLARIRARALAGDDDALAYLEWSAAADIADPGEVATDQRAWADSNPGLGIRITLEHIAREQRALAERTFLVERLGVGDWPDLEEDDGDQIIEADVWKGCGDRRSKVLDPVCFAFDVSPDRSVAAISAGGRREDGKRHAETVDHRGGTGWLTERLKALQKTHKPIAIRYDERSPAAALVTKLTNAGVKNLEPVTARQYTDAFGAFLDAANEDELRHLDTPELNAAVRGAAARPLGDALAWSRKSSGVDITPLVAATLALWGHEEAQSDFDLSGYRIRAV